MFEDIEFIEIAVIPNSISRLNIDLLPIPSKFDKDFELHRKNVNKAKKPFDSLTGEKFNKLSNMVYAYKFLKTMLLSVGYKVSTNATLKIHELLHRYVSDRTNYTVFCNCELPGAMLYDIIKTFPDCNWLASSYLESTGATDHTLLQDTYKLYEQNKDRWIMGGPLSLVYETNKVGGTSKAVETIEAGDASNAVEASNAGETSKAIEASEPSRAIEAIEASEPSRVVEASEASETVEVVEVGKTGGASEASNTPDLTNAMGGNLISGDVTDVVVVKAIAKIVHTRIPGGVRLYTSDAGFNIDKDYDTQEEQTMMVNYGQVLSGLVTLAPGGMLITKQYMFNHPFNRSLIALLSTMFDRLLIVKPLTSRPMNSEIYLVGIGARPISPETIEYMYSRLQYKYDYKEFIAPLCAISEDTERSIFHATNVIHGQQIRYIRDAMKITSKDYDACKIRSRTLSNELFNKLFM